MKQTTKNNLISGKQVVAGLIAASQCAAQAQEAKEQLESLDPTTVIATKFESKLSDVSASVAVLDLEQLDREGVHSLKEAIGYRTPGVISTSTSGQGGQPGSLFIRGTKSSYSQMRLDGVRITGSNAGGILNYLGAGNLNGIGSVEILKGAGSSIYGNGAIGGVVSLTSEKGEGEPEHKVSAEYGSFNSMIGHLSSKGQEGKVSYNVGLTAEDTQNDSDSVIDGNDFTQYSMYARFDYQIADDASLGFALRGGDAFYESPQKGNPLTNTPQKNNFDYIFGSLFYENQINESWATKLTLGFSNEDFDSRGFTGVYMSPGTYVNSDYDTNTERYSVYWDNEYSWNEKNASVASVYYENGAFETNYSDKKKRNTYGASLNHRWQIIDALSVNGRVGAEDHSDFGVEPTWGAGAIYSATESTRFKANIGTAFLAPQFSQAEFSPDLQAERSLNWDLGVEQDVNGVLLSATWFENDVDNFIKFDSTDSNGNYLYKNVDGETKASGLELAANARVDSIRSNIFASYTYNQRALATEIPQQYAAAGIDSELADRINAGLIGTYVDQAESYNGNSIPSYVLLNLYGNYQINDRVKVHARLENLLNSNYLLGDFTGSNYYDEVSSIKGRGRGLYAGVTATF